MNVFAVITVVSAPLGGEKTFEMPSKSLDYCKANEAYIIRTISNDLKASIPEFELKYECKERA